MERRSRVQVGRERESGGVDGEERWTAGRGKGESVVGRRDKAKDNKRRCVRDERKMNESHVVDIFTIWQGKPWQSRSKKKTKEWSRAIRAHLNKMIFRRTRRDRGETEKWC